VPPVVIVTVLNDRIVYAVPWRDRTQIQQQPIGLLEVLLVGQLSLPQTLLPAPNILRSLIARLVATFDSARISHNLIDILDRSGMFPDLALELIEKSPAFSDWRKHELALKALNFEKAYTFLLNVYNHSPGTYVRVVNAK
jgi:hypothetical protein